MNNLSRGDYRVVTVPFLENGCIDYERLNKEIGRICDPYVRNLIVCDSEGKFLTQISLEELRAVRKKTPEKDTVRFRGAYGIIITPFLENGGVDYGELERQLKEAVRSSIQGLVVCGSTGEFTYLSTEELKKMMLFTKEVIAGRKQLICGATAANCHETLELLAYIEHIGADGALVAPPYYFPLGDADVLDFYRSLAEAPGKLPIIAYQIPQCTSSISMGVFRELLKLSRIMGIKNSSGNCQEIMHQINLRNELRRDFAVLTGTDECIYAMVNSGADGSFTAIGYLYPELVSEVYRHQKDEEGLYWQQIIVKLAALAGSIPYPLGYKLLGEASGKMSFGTYLQAVSEERMEEYKRIRDRMQELLRSVV